MESKWIDIPDSQHWESVHPISKGWSTDKKFFVLHRSGEKFLLRIQEAELMEKEKALYDTLALLDATFPQLARLLNSGYCDKGTKCYRLFTWIDGQEAREVLPSLPRTKQYQLGWQSGRILRHIHSLPIPTTLPDWSSLFQTKLDRNLHRYRTCGIKVPPMDSLISYVQSHRKLTESRPNSFNHGDYHVGNMLITPAGELGVIDFNRLDFCDPWVEFDRITWCASLSPYFASGRIQGYFEGDIPPNFFPLMALYIGSNQLGGIYWTQLYDPEGVAAQVARTQEVLSWYQNFSHVIPTWYREHPPE